MNQTTLAPVYIIAFSGHRPKESESGRQSSDLDALKPVIEKELKQLKDKVDAIGGQLHLVASLAAGADVVACETARSLSLPIHLILPKPEEVFFRDDFSNDAAPWLDRAKALLHVVRRHENHVEEFDARSTIREIEGPSRSPDCYAAVNSRILEVADVAITVSTHHDSGATAGTSHVIRQADAINLPRINLNPADGGREDHRMENFARENDEQLNVFTELGKHLDCDLNASSDPFADFANCLGRAANNSSRKFRSCTKWAILCHALAGFIAAVAASGYYLFKEDMYSISYWILAGLALVELFLVGLGFYLEYKVGRNHEQAVWLDCRMATEIMRGLEKANPFLDPLFPEIRKHRTKWERFGLTCALQHRAQSGFLDPGDSGAVTAARGAYLDERVRNQIDYFDRELNKARLPAAWLKPLAHWAGPVAFVIVLVAFVAKVTLVLGHKADWTDPLKNNWLNAILFLFFPVFVPLLASLSASFLASFDFGRRIHRYEEMKRSLKHFERWISTLETVPTISASVRRCEETLLDENLEWLAAQKSGFGH
ncbi:MAG: hypothetical protein AAGA96_15960 [Verrucomicrobiota bacterium]